MYEGVGLYTKMESHDNSKMWKLPFLLQFYLYITLAFPPTFPSFPIIFFLKGNLQNASKVGNFSKEFADDATPG